MKISRFFSLSYELAKAEFKLRNEGSFLGVFWYLLNPLLTFLILFLVFSTRTGSNIPNYPIYLLLGIVIFNFFRQTTSESTRIIRAYKGIIKSINFPKETLVGSVVMKNIFSHFFEIILFTIFMIVFHNSLAGILFYPIILLFLCIFIYGFCLGLSALTVYFLDLENIWGFGSTLIWLGTPIFYSIGGQTKLFIINLFNPMYYFITASREIIINHAVPEIWVMAGLIGYSLISWIIGTIIFRRLKNKFAETI